MPSYTRVAAGNIKPSRFVKQSGQAQGQVAQATGASDQLYGISQEGTRFVPGDIGLDDGYAAIAGENLMIYGAGAKDVKLVMNGAGNPGDLIKSDADGGGLVTTNSGDWYGAILNSVVTAAGQIGRVTVVFPDKVH